MLEEHKGSGRDTNANGVNNGLGVDNYNNGKWIDWFSGCLFGGTKSGSKFELVNSETMEIEIELDFAKCKTLSST